MFRFGVLAVAALVVLTGCTAEPMPTPSPSPSASAAPIPAGDGVLTIGTLVPMTGTEAAWGLAQVAGVELAVREINEAGGIDGVPVVVHHRNSGDAAAGLIEGAFAELVERDVDVIIGPSSLELAVQVLPLAAEHGIAVITPAIADPAFSGLEDAGLAFSLVAPATGDGDALVAQLAGQRVALVHQSDAEGQSVRQRLEQGLAASGGEVIERVRIAPTTGDFTAMIDALRAARADAIVVVNSADRPEQNDAIVAALVEAGLAGDRLWLTRGFAVDRPELADSALEGVHVMRPAEPGADFVQRLRSAEPRLGTPRTGAEAYDAVILTALAAVLAGKDSGAALALALPDAANGGIPCGSWGECLHVLTTEDDIDYVGVSGPLDLDERGDVIAGGVALWHYTAAGTLELAP